jgi:CRP-like cAMP-binding protein
MPDDPHQSSLFRDKMLDPVWWKHLSAHTVVIPKHNSVYTSGDEDRMIYFIVSGQVKLVMDSPEGKECLIGIYSAGDLFGESCLASSGTRMETVLAMEQTILKKIPCQVFLAALSETQLRGFIQYEVNRMVEQQILIADLAMLNSEYRLGKALLQLSKKLGSPHSSGTIIRYRISQEELSQIVGTTRPRINVFINKFRDLGLISVSTKRFIIVRENRLAAYLNESFSHIAPASTHTTGYF